ncbi:hypothetical protein [Caldithrix abyssi]
MAKIILTLQEICDLIEANIPKHDAIKEVSVFPSGKQIALSVKTTYFPTVKLNISYITYQAGQLHFRIEGSRLITKLLDWFQGTPKPWLNINGAELFIQANGLLQKKAPGMQIMSVAQQEDGSFHIDIDLENKRF